VWQTTHLGGHRFAPTLVVLPQGLCYGRVEEGEVAALAAAVRQGEVFRLDRLRGRTALSRPEQMAEILVRERTGARGGALDDEIRAAMAEIVVEEVITDRLRPPSCDKEPEPVVVLRLRSGDGRTSA
jgi:hypothetical protein